MARRRREPSAPKLTQRMQLVMQRNMISPLLVGNASAQLRRPMRVLLRLAFPQRARPADRDPPGGSGGTATTSEAVVDNDRRIMSHASHALAPRRIN